MAVKLFKIEGKKNVILKDLNQEKIRFTRGLN